ncbi:MAG: hypothetical protein QXF04_01520 [Candidatus Aenigmatarchaeota archaeon]
MEKKKKEQLLYLEFNFFNFFKFYILFHILYLINDLIYFKSLTAIVIFFQNLINPLSILIRFFDGIKNLNILEINTFLIIFFFSFFLSFFKIRKKSRNIRKTS